MKIVFVLTVHHPNDDRVWYQQADSLRKAGHDVFVLSATRFIFNLPNVHTFDCQNLSKKEIIRKHASILNKLRPEVIICDNPVSILAAKDYKKKSTKKSIRIYYDVTEFYPSKIHLYYNNILKNMLKYCVLYCISIYVGSLVDGFIFGEYYKAKRYKQLFFWKKSVNLSYFASLEYIKTFPINNIQKECSFFYAGYISEDYGFNNILKVVKRCAEIFPETNFKLNVISKTECKMQETGCKNLKIDILKFLPFPEFCASFGKSDIFFDLRKPDIENTHCLPIKLFYYMAAGRPMIYSNLKAIRREISEIEEFSFLVNPDKTDEIVEKIRLYLQDPILYEQHCKHARILAETKYNWGKIEKKFIDFIDNE